MDILTTENEDQVIEVKLGAFTKCIAIGILKTVTARQSKSLLVSSLKISTNLANTEQQGHPRLHLPFNYLIDSGDCD